MRISDQRVFALVCGSVVFGMIICVVSAEKTHARPKYMGGFLHKYPHLGEQAKKKKCAVCHVGTDKKNRNHYGIEIAKRASKSWKPSNEEFGKVLEEVEKVTAEGSETTYGEWIHAGFLPFD